jgi:hypothetical protein
MTPRMSWSDELITHTESADPFCEALSRLSRWRLGGPYAPFVSAVSRSIEQRAFPLRVHESEETLREQVLV